MEIGNTPMFYRLLSGNETSHFLVYKLNELLAERPEYEILINALAIYPAAKWFLGTTEIDTCLGRILQHQEESVRLQHTQRIIQKTSGYTLDLIQRSRDKFMSQCSVFVKTIDEATEDMTQCPGVGYIYQDIFRILMTDEPLHSSKYYIKQNFLDAMEILYELYRRPITDAYHPLMGKGGMGYSKQETFRRNSQTCSLLREAERLNQRLQKFPSGPKRAAYLSEEELLRKLNTNNDFAEEYATIQYMRFIDAVICAVGDFPLEGNSYIDILDAIVAEKSKRATDAQISEKLGISTFTYSIKRRRAICLVQELLQANSFGRVLGFAKTRSGSPLL